MFSTNHAEGGENNYNNVAEETAPLEMSMRNDTEMSLGMGFQEGEQRRRRIDEETDNDRCIRKYTMCNILIVLLLLTIYKLYILIGFGYYTFKHQNREDCYADVESRKPVSEPIDDSNINVTFYYNIVI